MRILILCVLTLIGYTYSAKILCIFPMPAPSHYTIGFSLVKELALRGHDVTFVSPFKQKTPVKNLDEIVLTGFVERMQEMRKGMNIFDRADSFELLTIFFVGAFTIKLTEFTLEHENFQKLLRSNATFDLVIKEQFLDDALLGLAHHYQAPVILLSTIGSSIWTNRFVGNPAPPSYVPNKFLNYPPKMTFIQRTYNTLRTAMQELYDHLHFFKKHNELLQKHFPNAPHIYDLMYNVSLILLNSHTSFESPVPHVPSMIEIGGFHVEPPKKLPEHLQTYLDNSKEGVIYFSMGSHLKSKDLPPHKVQDILKVFSKLSLKVLWKWEDDDLPGLPANVKIEKWLPQPDVLAHPNVKIFITHGGLLSTIEAIYHGMPVVGIPVAGDQKSNMANSVNNGFAVLIPYRDLSEQTLSTALKEIINNPKYRENAQKRSRIMHDRQVKPIDEAVYWVDYVIRHKGAPHLRSAALDLTWYQYALLDVTLFLVLIAVVLFTLFYIIMKKILGRCTKSKEKIN